MLARMRAVLRRIPPDAELTTYTHGDLHVDLTHRLVTLKRPTGQLTPHEYALLRELANMPAPSYPIANSQRRLGTGPRRRNPLWPRLHRPTAPKARSRSPSPQLILTELRVGYRLTAPEPDRPRS
ncbi:MAG: hypothetical protein R2867_34345 [Caldilineaceae bacterium]